MHHRHGFFVDPVQSILWLPGFTITHKTITELIPKEFQFGNSSTKITECNSQSKSVRDSVILCPHYLTRPINSRNKSVR